VLLQKRQLDYKNQGLNAAFKMEEKSMMMIMNQRLDVVEIIKKG
jgi:hypothetical protein